MDYLQLRKDLLEQYKLKQEFRVSIGKSSWVYYKNFDERYNLREILTDEIVIEFDVKNKNIAWEGINFTGLNLYKAGINFEIWDHGGKSPHLHIHNLPIKNIEIDKRALFKKLFIRKYVPRDYLQFVDISLTGIHLIALEWTNHWKGCYGIKELVNKW